MAQQILPSNTFTTAKWIVSSTASNGTHTTIASALTSSSSGDTIFILPGTYTENLTLKAGVNLTAYGSDSSLNGTGTVIISGTCTLTTAGSVTISGIQLQTNSAALLAVTGSAASIVNLQNCYLNCSNTTGITFSTSNASGVINIYECLGNLGTTGIAMFAHSSAGTLNMFNTQFNNTGGSSTASTISAGAINIVNCNIHNPLTSSSTSAVNFYNSNVDSGTQNVTAFTCGGSGSNGASFTYFQSGTASAVSISQTLLMNSCNVNSTNTNAITGAGTVQYQGITFSNTSKTVNTTTQTASGTLVGSKNTAPSAGFLGEQIRASATGVSLSNATAANITSITLTAGVWDISGMADCSNGSSMSAWQVGISTNTGSFTGTVDGDSTMVIQYGGSVMVEGAITIPAFRVTISSSTTYYLVGQSNFGSGSSSAAGRISGTRVG